MRTKFKVTVPDTSGKDIKINTKGNFIILMDSSGVFYKYYTSYSYYQQLEVLSKTVPKYDVKFYRDGVEV